MSSPGPTRPVSRTRKAQAGILVLFGLFVILVISGDVTEVAPLIWAAGLCVLLVMFLLVYLVSGGRKK